ncbi:MAG: crotonase/enoyl-CoA hydratase family protein [Methyloligellaceae bacterium]
MTEHVSIEKHGNTQIIRINRPDKKNALTDAMYHGITDAFYAGEEDSEIRAHILTGTDGIFTAGNDIADFNERSQSDEKRSGSGVERYLIGQFEWNKPVIAAVDGLAVGIGTTLLFHCDLVYASERAQFITPFAGLGLTPENASSLVFPRAIGHQRAYELLCLGVPFSAEKAMQAGFVNEVVSAEELEAHALKIAARLAAQPANALKESKKLLRASLGDIEAVIRHEMKVFNECLHSEDARNALQAFLSKKSK